ncbi:hypothetical protein [Arthrobacter sp. EpRS71]|uniref:hypothetical protein n=1 Tax=Arthrobacter sp. EpRS71 TaxID=1743141 RepID=UPI0007496BF1|nr:hypothetical protein [Arthrobacter sp. EpRS71]KUM40384.1 hypothetical protein AR689_03080 [Arthrobacter sp. EpRS71]
MARAPRLGHFFLLPLSLAATLLLAGCGSLSAVDQPDALQRAEPGSCDAYGSKATSVREWAVDGGLDPRETSKSLQQAKDSASRSGGAIVQLPEGVFTLERPLVVKSKVSLRGAGPATVLKAGPDFLEFEGPSEATC